MFRFLLSVTFLAFLACNGRIVASDVIPTEVDVGADTVFVPVGFDDNDEVTVVLDGDLPDVCHRLIQPYVSIDHFARHIIVGARARKYRGNCVEVLVPYIQEVRIGRLRHGDYTVELKGSKITERLSVKEGNNDGPDDYLYAPVDNAWIDYPGGLKWVAVLEGRLPNDCFDIDETKVFLTGKTIQVLPIMKSQNAEECGKLCKNRERPFRIRVDLPYLPTDGRYLLHVRSLNGRSVNEAFYRTPHNS